MSNELKERKAFYALQINKIKTNLKEQDDISKVNKELEEKNLQIDQLNQDIEDI